jgi:predicted porin
MVLSPRVLVIAVLAASHPAPEIDTAARYRNVDWGDFKGEAPAGPEDAYITTRLSGDYQFGTAVKDDSGQWSVMLEVARIRCVMDRTKSGVKLGKNSEHLLLHEQYHFAITLYWETEYHNVLTGLVGTGVAETDAINDLTDKVKSALRDLNGKWKQMQDQYDIETEHGANYSKQSEWCKVVDSILAGQK